NATILGGVYSINPVETEKQSIEPLENKIHALEDETVTLSCNYESTATSNYLQWYRQYPGSRPEYLLMIFPTTKAVSHATPPFPHLNVTEQANIVNLTISSAAISDSALYYCALQPTVTENPATLKILLFKVTLYINNVYFRKRNH
uniref:Ig-like domain-containing protein n=1 Tax=Pygocentrus nattereri TaxID=42514 RepID=A0A3B4C0Z1_PYGNA